MKILLPVDGSTFSKCMLAYVAAHDEWLGDRHDYTVLHVTPALPPRAAAQIPREVLASYYAETSDKVFKPIRRFFQQQGLSAQFVTKVGPAAAVIIEVAQKGRFDLLLMGSHGHGSLGQLMLGSVTSKVLAHGTEPVLIVR